MINNLCYKNNCFIYNYSSEVNVTLYKKDCYKFLDTLQDNTIDLVLTDPPYSISKETGFKNYKKGVKRFAISTKFGYWDEEPINLDLLCKYFYSKLRKGGSCIIFYDLWKIESLKFFLQKNGFSMIRLIIWEKSNPVPINSKVNYLTNSREIAILAVKGSKPVFNSCYDKGNYKYPIEHSKERIHPTQKPLKLIKDLINKHSNEYDLVLDCFSGSGTTALACIQTNRHFLGCELDLNYYNKSLSRIKSYER